MGLFESERGVSHRDARRIMHAELVAEIRDAAAGMTGALGRLAGRIVNDVLAVRTDAFDATGQITLTHRVPIGMLDVRNLGTGDVTVVSGGPSANGQAPTVGTGVYVVPSGAAAPVHIGDHKATLYGKTGERVSLQAFARGGAPGQALSGIDGGSA